MLGLDVYYWVGQTDFKRAHEIKYAPPPPKHTPKKVRPILKIGNFL